MIITKHCRPEDREWMLAGHFKIGSHAEYSASEGTGLLSDNAEGRGATQVKGTLLNFTGNVAGARFKNCTVIGAETAIHVDERINTLMFCSSLGKYDAARHGLIISGNAPHYEPNPAVTSFLTLDASKLVLALTLATDAYFSRPTRWVCQPVRYSERIRIIPSSAFRGLSKLELRERLREQAFIKPVRFKCEEEFRFIMIPIQKIDTPQRLFTRELSESVHLALKAAIVNVGN